MKKYEYIFFDFNGTILDDLKLSYNLLCNHVRQQEEKIDNAEAFPIKPAYPSGVLDGLSNADFLHLFCAEPIPPRQRRAAKPGSPGSLRRLHCPADGDTVARNQPHFRAGLLFQGHHRRLFQIPQLQLNRQLFQRKHRRQQHD